MRFELTVALKYLIPRWRQLSVSIISLVSVLVISLVVWLVVLFLSVTDGIERKWIEQLVALNAPIRMAPTDAYYRSYYYQIDGVSLNSSYTLKTIGEKLASLQSDPYDPTLDAELSYEFPTPEYHDNGLLKDPVREGWEALSSLTKKVRPQEYEISFGNLRLGLVRKNPSSNEMHETFLTQVSYVASHDADNTRLKEMILPLTSADFNNLLQTLSNENTHYAEFFKHLNVTKLQTTEEGFVLTPSFFPEEGRVEGVGIVRHNQIQKVVIPQNINELESLDARLTAFGLQTTHVLAIFDGEHLHLSSDKIAKSGVELVLNEQIPFQARLIPSSLENAHSLHALQFNIQGSVQGLPLSGITSFDRVEIAEAHPIENAGDTIPFWIQADQKGSLPLPTDRSIGEGVLLAKHFNSSNVRVGDRGYLAYYTPTASSVQEQRIPIYVAGFYDPGMMPVGNKLLFVDPHVVALLRGNNAVSDAMLGNGVNIWLSDITQAEAIKNELIHALKSRNIDKYWKVQSYMDYDFARPILQQLQSDKNLFTLIAIIILIVACSNIISMLILLVNDKRREIGILQAMGASPKRIALIFGICGFVMGLLSCIIGTAAAIFTLHHLQSLVAFLSFLQGHEAFQVAFYGKQLPNELSYTSLLFVIGATMVISLIAGIVPAIKAARIRPTEILRAE